MEKSTNFIYVYENIKTGKRVASHEPINDKKHKLIRKAGKVINKV